MLAYRPKARAASANEKLNIGIIGVAGQGLVAGLPIQFALAAPFLELLSVLSPGGILRSPLIGLLLGALLAWMRVR